MSPDKKLLGRTNPLVGRLRRLSRSAEERAAAGSMLAEGTRLALEALAHGARVQEAIVSPRLQGDSRAAEIRARLVEAGIPTHEASDALLDSLHQADTHQGILLVVARPDFQPSHLIPSRPRRALVPMAFGIQDPGNLGALVRLTEAAGGTGILCVGGADPFGPKAVRASAGSIFRLPVARVGAADDALAFAAAARERGCLIAGAVPRGGASFRDVDLSGSMVLFLGGEGAGLPDEVTSTLDLRLSIPMRGPVESLNVASAAAILLFAAAGAR